VDCFVGWLLALSVNASDIMGEELKPYAPQGQLDGQAGWTEGQSGPGN
jgi:hypothetical protein